MKDFTKNLPIEAVIYLMLVIDA